ncbi:MAG: hypothetical protein JO154_08440 [Chitinophaga sp.]|uniref:hypothetical protein n=1 Tax=Chitinophaga sp. TaxID=1869181 RepID=UPI0025C01644|nr:hypothetical protein [Chitinophaga sp.]MBV8252621.1 hypothetical protein [Chitinophaga sp.]
MKIVTLICCLLAIARIQSSAQDSSSYFRTNQMSNAIDNFMRSRSIFTANSFSTPEGTVGTPYLFEDWGYMWLDSIDNEPVKKSVIYQANMDLQKNEVIIKGGDGKAYIPETNNVQAMHFKKGNEVHAFVRAYLEGAMKFVEQLSTEGKYILLKDIGITYTRADYTDKGMVQTGKPYNEYKKKYTYYLVQDSKATRIQLKKKNILSVLDKDPAAVATVNKYIPGSTVDEAELVKAIDALNAPNTGK